MNNEQLKQAIQQVVKTNGRNEITGANLQSVLIDMVNALGAGYQFAGVAVPGTTPVTGDQRIFYLAGAGDYSSGFGSDKVVPPGSIGVLLYDTGWRLSLIAVSSGGSGGGMTVETFSGILLQAQADTYYRADAAVDNLTVQLPAVEGNDVKSVILGITTGSSPVLSFTAADGKAIRYVDGYLIKALTSYEINIMYNGLTWTVAYVVIASN